MAVQRAAKDGVNWVHMHKLANQTLLAQLKAGGLLRGEINEMMAAGINGIFQPHGLGHLLGIDVHDVGSYLDHCPPRPKEPGVTALRFARDLKAGMYVTIEPGCYFIDHLLDKALNDPIQKKFLVPEVINRFRNFGGVRIEDDVLITKTGCENFAIVPRTYVNRSFDLFDKVHLTIFFFVLALRKSRNLWLPKYQQIFQEKRVLTQLLLLLLGIKNSVISNKLIS